jgi:hypothetical protein
MLKTTAKMKKKGRFPHHLIFPYPIEAMRSRNRRPSNDPDQHPVVKDLFG